jgi:hypothetical protein
VPAVPAATAAQPGKPADAEALRARWPDVLEAVQGKRRVAWMQLSHASVESFADNVLTLAFAQAGVAKGFITGGYDADLGQVLETLFGITPMIRTEVLGTASSGLNPGAGTRPPEPGRPAGSGSAGSGSAGSGSAGSGSAGSGSAGSSSAGSSPEGAARAAPPAAQARAREAAAAGARGRRQPERSARPAPEADPEPSDPAAPDVLTGTNLIERELGGRIIQELGEP